MAISHDGQLARHVTLDAGGRGWNSLPHSAGLGKRLPGFKPQLSHDAP